MKKQIWSVKTIRKGVSAITGIALAGMMLAGCGTTNVAETPETTETVEEAETIEEKETQEGEVSVAAETPDATASGHMTAQEFADGIVVGWNLGNTLDSYIGQAGQLRNDGLTTETSWGNPKTTHELISTVKEVGFNTIRIPVTWYNHMDPESYEIDPEWMARVHEVVDYALDEDTYVILNMHHDTGTNGWLHASDENIDQKKEIYQAAWKQIAEDFSDYEDNLVFEGFNEILDDNCEWTNPGKRALDITNEFNQIFVDTVRATGKNNEERVLLINTYCAGNGKLMLNNFEIPTDSAENALCAEVHAYTPYYFTAPEFPDITTWDEASVKSTLQTIKTAFQLKKVPVIIGEFGTVDKNNEADRIAYVDYFVSTAKEMGLKCIWWDNGIADEYAIFDRKTLQPSQPGIVDAIIKAATE